MCVLSFYQSVVKVMASDIQIVNISNFEKIQSFLNDSAYKEILENSETFNTRLCIERRLRMPFLDPQTGVAQTHCALFMKAKQRMPGFRSGQIYTYPSTRWRKPKRQYLLNHQSYKAYQFRETHNHHHHHHNNHHSHHHQGENTASSVSVDGNSLGASGDNDSKDGHPIPEKEWYYEEMELPHPEDFEEEIESDMDFEESYSGRKKKRNRNTTKKTTMSGETTPKRGRKVGSKTRKNLDIDGSGGGGGASNAGTGGGVGGSSSSSTSNSKRRTSTLPPPPIPSSLPLTNPEEPQMPVLIPEPKIAVEEPESSPKKTNKIRAADRGKAQPSPYCDFCLGDARENKKTNVPEELVSCSDCGRSGHPTCLQFTPNMIISVKRYRWQCIECKYCSICGTSDNDDQLLFCDDCDRGYHMYCLTPPLTTPPEGSWSCQLCMEEFHSGKK